MSFSTIIRSRSVGLGLITLAVIFLSFAQSASAQPSRGEISQAIANYLTSHSDLPSHAELGDFEHRVFEQPNEPGVGRIAISGAIFYNQDIIEEINSVLFNPPGMSDFVRGYIGRMANVAISSRAWRVAYTAGTEIGMSGNIFYQEEINDYSWEYDLDFDMLQGRLASELPPESHIIGSRQHQAMEAQIQDAIPAVESIQEDFRSFVEREVVGHTFLRQNECEDDWASYGTFFSMMVDDEPKQVEFRDLFAGNDNFFGSYMRSRQNKRLRVLAEAVVWANYDFSVNTTRLSSPNWENSAQGRVAFSFTLVIPRAPAARTGLQLEVQLDRKIAWMENGELKTSTYTNFIGSWRSGEDFVGFRNRGLEQCATITLRRTSD